MKVAVIGCGGIGKTHARAYQSIPGVEILYMIDRIPEAAEAAAAEFGAKALTSLDEMTEMPDLVSVVTPPSAHFEPIMALIEKGIPVFSEKPLTMDIEECRAIVKAAAEKNVQVAIGFKMRFEPVFQKAHELVERIGDIYAVSVVKNQPYGRGPGSWIPNVGCMYELSVHEYDLVNWIAGLTPETVSAELGYSMGWNKENRAYLDINYAGGIKGQLMSMYLPDTKFTFSDLTITYVGSKGYMRVERPDRIFLHTDHDEIIDVVPQDNTAVFARELGGFIDCLKSGKHYYPDAREGANITSLIETARRSSQTGERLTVEKL